MPIRMALIRENFEFLSPKFPEIIDQFYKNLFERHPEYEPLFADTDLRKQRRMLIASLYYIATNIESPTEMKTALGELGARHAHYGATAEKYPPLGICLIDAIAVGSGEKWTQELQDAWRDAFAVVTEMMLAGANAPTEDPTP